MLNREELFAAIGGIDDELVLSVLQRLESAGRKPLAAYRKGIRVALIAAVIAALLAATALASELLGLNTRLVPSENRSHISLNGLAGSDEYRACAEWVNFCEDYEVLMSKDGDSSWIDSFHSFARTDEEKDICRIYGARDVTMYRRLLEISEKYGVKLLTDITYAPSETYLFRTTGLSPYIRGVEHYEYGLGSFLFEDGSFKDECSINVDGRRYAYTLTCIHTGVLYPFSLELPADTQCREWEHTTAEGLSLSMALFGGEEEHQLLILCNSPEIYVTLSLRWDGGTEEEAFAEAEILADCFDFAVLCGDGK